MSTMHSKIKDNIKEAMKDHDIVTRDCLKSVLGKAQEAAKESRLDTENIPDDVMYAAVQREVKQLNQTLTSLKGCEETNLYIVSEQQLEILKDYLPKQMSQQEVEEAVAWILGNNLPDNMGKRIGMCMKELKGKADSKLIRKVVENYK